MASRHIVSIRRREHSAPAPSAACFSLDDLGPNGDRVVSYGELVNMTGVPQHIWRKWCREKRVAKFDLGCKRSTVSLRSALEFLEKSRQAQTG